MAGNPFDGMSVFVKRETFGSERYALIEFYVVAYDTGGSYHHSCAVVYREVMSYACGRMDVDAGFGVCHFRDDARNERYAQCEQFVCYAVVAQCFDDRITTDDFSIGFGCGVAVVSGLYVSSQYPA